MTVGQVLYGAVRHPVRRVIRQWHWKSALVSALMRALIFLVVNLQAGAGAGARAFITELLFRTAASGVLGGLTQSLRHAEPPAAATASALLLLPTIGHAAEYVVHSRAGTPFLTASVAGSIGFTCLTTLGSLFAMRRGVFIVGQGQLPLREDFRRIPWLVMEAIRGARQ